MYGMQKTVSIYSFRCWIYWKIDFEPILAELEFWILYFENFETMFCVLYIEHKF